MIFDRTQEDVNSAINLINKKVSKNRHFYPIVNPNN